MICKSKNIKGKGRIILYDVWIWYYDRSTKENLKQLYLRRAVTHVFLRQLLVLLASSFLHPILVGNEEEVLMAAEEAGYNIRGAQIIDCKHYDRFDEMVERFCELRKGKGMTPEEARKILETAKLFWYYAC